MTLILGKSIATAKQMSTYLLSVNKNPKFSKNITTLEFCQLFIDICEKEGVRGDIAFAQSCKETGNFTFNGDVKYTQNNFAGIGAIGNGICGCVFKDIETGILAQAQHLKTYATKSALNKPCVDPRRTTWFINTKGGTAKNVEDLSGTWAVPGYDTKKYPSLVIANNAKDSYGYQILDILNNILKIKEKEESNMVYTNSPLVDYTRISPNSTNPRKSKIKKIVIHHMAGNLSVETCGNVFANPSRKASANYGIGTDGRVGLYVEECNRAWTSGNATVDNEGVTIEVANDTTGGNWHVSDKALEKTIELCVDICKRNGIEKLNFTGNKNGNLVAHRYYQATACPGEYLYSKFPYIANEVNKRLGVNVETTATTTRSYLMKGDKGKEVKVLQENLNYLGYSCGTADGDFGTKTDTALRNFQKAYKLTVDGKYGATSKKTLEDAVAKKKNSSTTSNSSITVSGGKYIFDGLDYSLVFNPTYYANKYNDLRTEFGTNATKLFSHFCQYGMREARQAITTFNVTAYRNRYTDLQKAFGNDLPSYYRHYIEYGKKEGRSAV